jgi:integrase
VQLLPQFLTAKAAAGLAQTTLDWYKSILTSFAAAVPSDPTPADVEAYLADLRSRGLKPASVRGHYNALSAYFAWRETRTRLPSPIAPLTPPRVPRRRQKAATPEEVTALLASIPKESWIDLRDRLMVRTLSLAGLRISALVQLEIGDYDTATEIILIRHAKGGDERTAPLLPDVRRALIEYLWMRPPVATPAVNLASDGNGTPTGRILTANGARQRLHRLCERAGIRYLNPHSFRHGLAVHLLNDQGADMALIQRILGHKRQSTTADIYARWTDAGAFRQFKRLMT